MVTRLEYLEHFLDAVDFLISGRKGSISEDRWLQVNYDASFYSVLEKQLKNTDDRVRAETVSLLTSVRERAAAEIVRELRRKDNDRVVTACLGYLKTMDEDDDLVIELMDILEYKRGTEFRNAAMKMGKVGRSEDVPTLRRIYGQVDGEMRADIKECLTRIIDRDPELKAKRDLLLSVPVFPNEKEFISFLRSAEDYLDIRYRRNILPKRAVSMNAYNNMVRGLRRIRVRLFNESSNLIHYSDDLTDRYNDAVDLLAWATGDLLSKEVYESESEGMECPRCGSMMIGSDDRRCIECGYFK